jgi:enoyl-CoA hydratase/carnithine racemase
MVFSESCNFGGGSVRLPRLIGTARVMDMILTGRTYDARGGEAIGLSQYVTPDQALSKAVERAHQIAGNAALSNFAIVQALPRIGEPRRRTRDTLPKR